MPVRFWNSKRAQWECLSPADGLVKYTVGRRATQRVGATPMQSEIHVSLLTPLKLNYKQLAVDQLSLSITKTLG